MKNESDASCEKRMQRWKMREEMLNAMSEKELRAFIKGYMMAEHTIFRRMTQMCSPSSCNCQECSSCKGESCDCGDKECKGCKE